MHVAQLDDKYGSPSTVDVETFARAFNAELDAALGDFAADLEREVSSPVSKALLINKNGPIALM